MFFVIQLNSLKSHTFAYNKHDNEHGLLTQIQIAHASHSLTLYHCLVHKIQFARFSLLYKTLNINTFLRYFGISLAQLNI